MVGFAVRTNSFQLVVLGLLSRLVCAQSLARLPMEAKSNSGQQSANETQYSTNSSCQTDSLADDLYSVNLKRQRVPVEEEGEDVYYKTAYFGMLSVGTPKKDFAVVFDTGSGHLILPSTMCQSATCKAHRRFKRAHSSTAIDIDGDGTPVLAGNSRDQISINFGTGEVTGVFVEEFVCMGQSAMVMASGGSGSLTTVGQAGQVESRTSCVKLRMISATEMTEDPFSSFEFDGIMGLGLPGLSQSPEFNLVGVMTGQVQGGSVKPHIFSVFLAEAEEEQSEITFGGWRPEHMHGQPSWAPVTRPEYGYWQINITSVRIGSSELPFCQDSSCRGVVDTGTSLLAVPTAVFPELQEMLRHPAMVGKCLEGYGPELHFELEGGFTVTLQPEDYANPERQQAAQGFTESESRRTHVCEPMLMAMDLAEPLGPKLFILGEPVLRKYYTVYDAKEKSVGFGLAVHPGSAPLIDNLDEKDLDDAEWEPKADILGSRFGHVSLFQVTVRFTLTKV